MFDLVTGVRFDYLFAFLAARTHRHTIVASDKPGRDGEGAVGLTPGPTLRNVALGALRDRGPW